MDETSYKLSGIDSNLIELQKLSLSGVTSEKLIFEALIEIARALNLQTEVSLQRLEVAKKMCYWEELEKVK
jgi:hypothetical protein